MEVFLANEQDLPVDEARLSALGRHVLTSENVDASAELSILLVSRDHIRHLNARFAGDDHPTDVLAFPMMEEDEDDGLVLGDVVICPRIAQGNAAARGQPLTKELEVLLTHGTLHLLGYDHESGEEAAGMERRLYELLQSFRPARAQ
jgi:probable rRNA maturation factor